MLLRFNITTLKRISLIPFLQNRSRHPSLVLWMTSIRFRILAFGGINDKKMQDLTSMIDTPSVLQKLLQQHYPTLKI